MVPDTGRAKYENRELQENVRGMFARLIGAKPTEIAFVPSTQVAENLVVDGLRIHESGGNVVTNDLHYGGSLFNYRSRKARGLDVRIVKHKDYTIDLADMEKAIDGKTRLVSLVWVSNVNGYLHDIEAISDLAHRHGAYVFIDVIQAAGAVPIDVREMGGRPVGLLGVQMADGGRFGYLYVRKNCTAGLCSRCSSAAAVGREGCAAVSGQHAESCWFCVSERSAGLHTRVGGREHPDPCAAGDRKAATGIAGHRIPLDHPALQPESHCNVPGS